MICTKCSETVPDGSIFCNRCGKRLAPTAKPRKPKARGNGQGTAYKSPDGKTWTAQVIIDYRPPKLPGHQPIPIKRKKSGFAKKSDALAYCPILKAGGLEKKKSPPRLSAYWDAYKDDDMLKLAKNTQSAYRTAWNKLKPLHDIHVNELTVAMLRTAVADSCTSYDTTKDCKSLLQNLFNLAGADGFVNKDLPSYIVLPEHEEAETIPFTVEEQKAIWKAYDEGDRRAAVHLLMIYTGMMPGETQKLRVENINLEERTITHNGLKTRVRKKTPVVLADSILPVVEDLLEHAQPSGYIWKRNEKKWYQNYYDLLEDAGCRKLKPYSCRHTTATALAVDENIAPHIIKKVMRWSTVKMLDKYAHPKTADALEAVNTIGGSNGGSR